MGRLTDAKKATSNSIDKAELAEKRSHFSIVDIDSVESSFSPNGQWKLEILIDGETELKSLYFPKGGARDALMTFMQDGIAKEGPYENCYLHGKKNSFGNMTWVIGEVGDKDYKPF